MTYVDGFVAAVPTANREIYKKHAEAAAIVFKEHGALKLVECWGDDVPDGKVTLTCPDSSDVSLRWLPSLAAVVPDGTVQQRAGARRPHLPQRPSPLRCWTLVLLFEPRTR
jgi:hypothetical protein